jgi:hypothetical protein
LGKGTSARTCTRSYGSSLAASGYRSDDGANSRPAASKHTGPLIGSNPFFAPLRYIGRAELIFTAFNGDTFKVQDKIGCSPETASLRRRPDHYFCVCSPRDYHRIISVEHVFRYFAGKSLALNSFRRIYSFLGTNRNLCSNWNYIRLGGYCRLSWMSVRFDLAIGSSSDCRGCLAASG